MDRWEQIERIFLAASELPSHEQQVFVDQEANGDTELLAAVLGMLRHCDDGVTHIREAVERTAISAADAPEPVRTHIDRYSVVRELGRGGMGAVYLAERTDREFHQPVAIKVVKRGMDTAQIVERFRHERRILASLDHPNIARLFDGGATADGVPYLVMEYIEGRPLIEYCRESALSLRDRLILFESICAAVQHAHQKLIVHRDIKPANVLITAAGVPKLLDFGIAKLILPQESESPPDTLTRSGVRMLTPEYASPEQILGDPVSVASDIYSLGAVLYELLSGKRAHQFKSHAEAEFMRVICETEPPLPSQVAEDPRTRRQLSGDLDNIVALALRKEPARRYVSVEQFAGDIRRYLEGLPVIARGERPLYRARKFLTRNRVPVAAGALVLISLTAGIIGTTLQARRADLEAAQAKRRFEQVRKLANTFVFDIYDGMANLPGTAEIRVKVVSTALQYLDSLASEAEGDTALQMELAAAYRRIGDVQGNSAFSGLGRMPAALASYQKAIAVLNRLVTRVNPDPKALADLANLERITGLVRLDGDDPGGALEHQRRSIAAWERRSPQRGQDFEADTGIAQAWGYMGRALSAQGDAEEAVRHHTAGVGLLRGWLTRRPLPSTRGTLSLLLHDLGKAQRDSGDLRGAVATYREALRIRRQIVEEGPTNFNQRRRIFILNFSLATVHGNPLMFNLGEQAIAETHASEAFREGEAMAKEDPGTPRSIRDRYFGNWIMGCVLIPAEARRAVPYLKTALLLATSLAVQDKEDPFNAQIEAEAQEALGRALLATGERAKAIELLRYSSATIGRLSARSPKLFEYRFALIRLWNTLGDSLPAGEGLEFYRKAYEAAEAFPAGQRHVLQILGRAEVDLRWARWNPGASPAERQRILDRAREALEKLAARAPSNRAIQASLAAASRSF